MDGLGIGAHLGGGVVFDLQLDILCARNFAKTLHRFLQKVSRRDRLDVETLFAGFHPRQGEQIFGEARHAQSALANDVEKFAGVVVFRRAVEQGLGVALNGSQRSAQFVRDVGNKIAARFLHPLGLGKITQHGHRAAAGHGRGGHVEGASRQDGCGPRGKHLACFTCVPHRGQEIGIANGLDQRSVLARVLRDQFVHGLVRPLHAIVGADGDDGILHAVEQGFELALAGLQSGETFFQMAGGLVQRGGDLSDFVRRTLRRCVRSGLRRRRGRQSARCAASGGRSSARRWRKS